MYNSYMSITVTYLTVELILMQMSLFTWYSYSFFYSILPLSRLLSLPIQFQTF